MNLGHLDLVRSICEEFCDCVLVDEQNASFLIYVTKKYYQPLSSRLAQLDVVEIFRNKRRNKNVVLYQVLGMVEEDVFFEDDDEDDVDFETEF